MPQTVIVYYSRTGTTRQVAQAVAARTGWPLAEVADVKSRAGFLGDLRCVMDNLLQRSVAFRYNGPPLDQCDDVVVLAPVWVVRLAAPMRSFLAASVPKPPLASRVAAICLMGGRGGFQAEAEIARLVGKKPSPALVLAERDVLSGAANAEIDTFVQSLRSLQAEQDPAARPAWLSPKET
ncbi:flavodoxin family protein [Cupriavidus campinensis]